MKIILIIICGLFGVAQAQTTGYFRYDTTRFQKGGGNNEVYIENGTKALTGGVFTNMGNGLGRWITPAMTVAGWKLTGNAGTTAGTNFLGTTDNVDLVFKRQGNESGRLTQTNSSYGYLSLTNNITGTGTDNTAIGELSLYLNEAGSRNIGLGAHAGRYNLNDSFRLYINSIQRGNILGDTTKSIIYGAQDSIAANQRLYLNAKLIFPYVPSGVGIYALRVDAAGNVLKADTTAGGGSSSLTVGTTAITSGTSGRVLYNNAGVLGEYTTTGTGNVMFSASPTTTGTFTGAAANFSGDLAIGGTGLGARLGVSATDAYIRAVTTSSTGFARFRAEGDAITNLFEGFQFGSAVAGNDAIGLANANLALLYTGSSTSNMVLRTGNASSNIVFGAGAGTARHLSIIPSGNVGIGVDAPTAKLHIGAGIAAASGAPLKLTAGVLLPTPEAGAVEFDGTHLYGTIGSTRHQLDQQYKIVRGQYSTTAAAMTTFTVTIGETQANNTYNLAIAPTSVLAGASYYISAKTTTTFDVTYLTAITGAVNLDWTLFK